jgi:hypothetical protein
MLFPYLPVRLRSPIFLKKVAERFFGRSRSWITHKLNHDLKNGKPDDFTEAERAKLKDALDTIAYEIQILSDNM